MELSQALLHHAVTEVLRQVSPVSARMPRAKSSGPTAPAVDGTPTSHSGRRLLRRAPVRSAGLKDLGAMATTLQEQAAFAPATRWEDLRSALRLRCESCWRK